VSGVRGAGQVLINGFKPHAVLVFPKGALLEDPAGLLSIPGENSLSARQARFTDLEQIHRSEMELKALVLSAIALEQTGKKVEPRSEEAVKIPDELTAALDKEPALKAAFEALTPGRRKAYLMHFSDSSQAKTRIGRIDKARERILAGKGLNDCVCGLSKRMPGCDGSHKALKGA